MRAPKGAPDLLRQLEAVGLSVTATGGNLIVRPHDAITPELRSLIRVNNPALLSALTTPEKRSQRVLRMLDANPKLNYALTGDNERNPVIVTLAIRGNATCEFEVSRDKYGPFLLLDLLQLHDGSHNQVSSAVTRMPGVTS